MIEIKPINEDYLGELVWLSRQTFSDAFEAQTDPKNYKLYVENNLTEEVLGKELEASKTQFFFAYTQKGELLGYLKVRWDRPAEVFDAAGAALELQRIYILKEHWNKGYGKNMLDFVINWAKFKGFDWVWLIVWFKNEGAIRFYEREGWEICGRKDFKFGDEIHHDYVFRVEIGHALSK